MVSVTTESTEGDLKDSTLVACDWREPKTARQAKEKLAFINEQIAKMGAAIKKAVRISVTMGQYYHATD